MGFPQGNNGRENLRDHSIVHVRVSSATGRSAPKGVGGFYRASVRWGKVSEPGFGLGKNHLRYGLRSESESVTFGSRKLESAKAGFGKRTPRGWMLRRTLPRGFSRLGAALRRPSYQLSVVSSCSVLVSGTWNLEPGTWNLVLGTFLGVREIWIGGREN